MSRGIPKKGFRVNDTINPSWFQKNIKPWNFGLKYSHKIQRECEYCGKIFYVHKGVKENKGKYCSHRCAGKITGFQTGCESWNKGKKGLWHTSPRPPEIIEKIRKAKIGIKLPKISGKNHYKWSGGYSRNYILDKDWKQKVFERDDFICQNCGNTGYLEAHHIKSWKDYPELRSEFSNGITLCLKCHYAVHGRKMRSR